ncbi:MAG: tetratricopeptide repeat protein [Geobacter sp.]|nr:tetratricopeptide repeat protein [Geobacter sp.]
MSSGQSRLATKHIALILLLVIGVYANSLLNGFALDDEGLLLLNPAVHGFSSGNVSSVFTSVPNKMEYLPVRDLSYMLDYQIWGLNPFGYHLANLLYYLLVCAVVYLLVCKVLRLWEEKPEITALFASLLFAVHPLHVESVAAISQRKDLLSTLFLLNSIYFYINDKCRRWEYPVALLAFVLAIFSKATVLSAPIVMVGLDLARHGRKTPQKAEVLLKAIPFFGVAASASMLNTFVMQRMGVLSDAGGGIQLARKIATIVDAFAYYLKIIIFPYPLNINPPFLIKPFNVITIASLIAIIAIVAVAVIYRRTQPVITLAIGWWMATMLPILGMAASRGLVAERYMILPSLGYCLLLGWGLCRLLPKPHFVKAVVPFLMLLIVIYGTITIRRNFDWKDSVTLYLQAIKDSPKKTRNYWLVASEYFGQKNYTETLRYLDMARRLNPNYNIDYEVFSALIDYQEKRYDEAFSVLDRLPSPLRDDILEVNYLYGKLYETRGDRDKTLFFYRKALASSQGLRIIFPPAVSEEINRVVASGR